MQRFGKACSKNNKLGQKRNDTINKWRKSIILWICCICRNEICTDDTNKKKKVRDNCHYIEKYRDTANNVSNLRYKMPKKKEKKFI